MKYLLALLATILLAGCTSSSPYEHASNWLIRQNDVPHFFSRVDIFYLTPETHTPPDSALEDLTQSERSLNAYHHAFSQTSNLFGAQCRIFAPKVRLMPPQDFLHCLQKPHEQESQEKLAATVTQVTQALDYYLNNFHQTGHPFILMADGQGAWALYQAIKRTWDITVDNGFVAAYLPGMPPLKRQQLQDDFPFRKLTAPEQDSDYGVIITWNAAVKPPPLDSPFHCPQAVAINPISWQTHDRQAAPAQNRFALFYQGQSRRLQDRQKKIPHPCGAYLNPQTGLLHLTHLNPEVPLKQLTCEDGLLHQANLALFAGNIAANARKRTEQLIHDRKWDRQP